MAFVPAALVAANPGLAKLLFALVFPVGLTMNTLHGTELFTGNTMKLPAAIYEGKTNMAGLIKNWFWSYSGALLRIFAETAMNMRLSAFMLLCAAV